MDWVVAGLPLHPLFVHAAVVLVPLAALAAIAGAFWPAFRRRMGVITPILATAAGLSVLLAVEAGQWLEEHVAETAAVQAHTSIGERVTPWVALLVVFAWVQWGWHRFFVRGRGERAARVSSRRVLTAATVLLAVALTATGVGATVAAVVVGDSGARATWAGTVTTGDGPEHDGDGDERP